jgi:nicotinamide riboside transporter PnuC
MEVVLPGILFVLFFIKKESFNQTLALNMNAILLYILFRMGNYTIKLDLFRVIPEFYLRTLSLLA